MRKELVYSGFVSIVVGSLITLAGGATSYQWLFYLAGIALIVSSLGAGHQKNKLKSLFIACKLFTEIDGKKIFPKVISKTELENGFQYRLTIPTGLCSGDFNNKAQAFSEAYNKKVEFKYDQGKLLMTAVEFH